MLTVARELSGRTASAIPFKLQFLEEAVATPCIDISGSYDPVAQRWIFMKPGLAWTADCTGTCNSYATCNTTGVCGDCEYSQDCDADLQCGS